MKTKEELNALKEEVETVSKKLHELTEEELSQVSGGTKQAVQLATTKICDIFRKYDRQKLPKEAFIIEAQAAAFSIPDLDPSEKLLLEPLIIDLANQLLC